MAAPNVTLDGDALTIEINKGNKQWVAEITGTDPQYDLDRNFIGSYGRGTETVTVENGDIIERVYYSYSGNEKGRVYWIVHEGELLEIDQGNVEDALENPGSYYPEPERHECEECGDEFGSEHGLAVHAGLVHDDEDETDDEDTTEPTTGGDETSQPVATDGGVATDGSGETDWELVAGGEPSRNGTRRIVDTDEARTKYEDSGTYYDELLGIDIEIGTRYSDDTITYVNLRPQVPKRARGATGTGWLARLAVDEGDYDDLYEDGAADEPLPGYQAETTADYREADPEDPRGDGVYLRDDADSALTAEIADVVTREGGRIPVEFSAAVQNEGYARSRKWRVYAPAHNPHHVAAAVTDLLRDADGVSEVRVHVSDKPASRIARRLRANGIGHTFDSYGDDSEDGCIERSLRELRWESGLPAAQQRILQAVPSEARERVQQAEFDDQLTDYESQLRTLHQRPGDAWDYNEVTIHINEEAAKPYYG